MTNEVFVQQTIQHITQVAANAIASVTSEISELSKTNNSVAALNLVKLNNTANKAITDISNAYNSGIGNIAGIIEAEVIKANEVKVLAEQQLNDKVALALKEIDEILNSGRAILQKDVDAVISETTGVIPEKGREQSARVTKAGNEVEASIRRLLSLTAESGKAASVGVLVENDIAVKRNYRICPNITPTLCIKHPSIYDTIRGRKPSADSHIIVKNGVYYSNDSVIATIKDGCMDIHRTVYDDGGTMLYAKCPFSTYFFNGTNLYKNGVIVSGEDIDYRNIIEYAKFNKADIDSKTCVDISLYGLDLTEYWGTTEIAPNTILKTDSFGYVPNTLPSTYKQGGKLSSQTSIANRTVYIDKDNIPYIAKRDVAAWANKDVADANFIKYDLSTLLETLLNS